MALQTGIPADNDSLPRDAVYAPDRAIDARGSSQGASRRHLPPGAAYADSSRPPGGAHAHPNLHRPAEPTRSDPPTLSLAIGPANGAPPSPLVGSTEWPMSSSSAASRGNSPAPALAPPVPPSAEPQFVGIPAGRVQQQQSYLNSGASSPSPRQTQSAHFPSFALPSNLAVAADRGPYPPHVRSQSTGNMLSNSASSPGPGAHLSSSQLGLQGGAEDSQTLLAPTRGQLPSSVNRLSIADQIVGTSPVMSATPRQNTSNRVDLQSPGAYDRRSYLDDSTTPVTASDMAGVGRNSIIRSVGAASPVNLRNSVLVPGAGNVGGIATSPNLEVIQTSPQLQNNVALPPRRNSIQPLASGPNGMVAPPPHLVPQPEICVECMMRDRDMADVDVTTVGIWERDSDRDWKEQLKWEQEEEEQEQREQNDPCRDDEREQIVTTTRTEEPEQVEEEIHGTSRESGSSDKRRASGTNTSHSRDSRIRRRKLGKGQALTSGNLKVWTSMNPPAAAHRWRTLQTFLAMQIHLLELERQARARDSALLSSSHSHAPSQNRSSRSSAYNVPLSATPEPYDPKDVHGRARAISATSRGYLADETNRRSLVPNPGSLPPLQPSPSPTLSPYPTHPQYAQPPTLSASAGPSIQSYSYGDQPWLSSQGRRHSASRDPQSAPSPAPSLHRPGSTKSTSPSMMKFSIPKFARSSSDLRSISTPRSISPARNSLNVDDRRNSVSLWNKFRNSHGNQSVMSFNPSGSMMDMHLGLSQDKHVGGHVGGPYSGYASSTIGIGQRGYSYHPTQNPYDTYSTRGLNMSDPAVARHAELRERDRALAKQQQQRQETEKKDKKKKKGIKGFFSKLVGGGNAGTEKGAATPGQRAVHENGRVEPATVRREASATPPFDDDELAPPPPLSALANEPRYHQRSSSTSSVDSYSSPYTPPLVQQSSSSQFRTSYTMPLPASSSSMSNVAHPSADRQSILTMGSYSSVRSKNYPTHQAQSAAPGRLNPSRDSVNRPSFDSLNDSLAVPQMGHSPSPGRHRDEGGSAEILLGEQEPHERFGGAPVAPQPRQQKSLPSLPTVNDARSRSSTMQDIPVPFPKQYNEHQAQQPHQFYPNHQDRASRSAYSLAQYPTRPLSPPDSVDERDRNSTIGSRSGRKTRSTVFSFFGGSKKQDVQDSLAPEAYDRQPPRAASFDMISRY